MDKLISMTDFVLGNTNKFECLKYANFLKQPLTLIKMVYTWKIYIMILKSGLNVMAMNLNTKKFHLELLKKIRIKGSSR